MIASQTPTNVPCEELHESWQTSRQWQRILWSPLMDETGSVGECIWGKHMKKWPHHATATGFILELRLCLSFGLGGVGVVDA